MARSGPSKRQKRALNTLQDKGIGLCALGLVFLITPLFMGSSPILMAVTTGLRIPGWLALAAGAVLLGIHHITRAKVAKTNPLPQLTPRAPSLTEKTVQPDIGDDIAEHRREPSAATPLTRQVATSWSPAVFAAIEWRRFEAVCEALFAQAGFQTRSQSHGADGGVDIWLHSANTQGPVAVVQCKHWHNKPVGVKEIREFFGVMASHQLKRGTYATTSTYTADAQQFAKDNGINAMDGAALLGLIAKRTPEQQQAAGRGT